MANRRSGKLWTPGLLKSRGWTKELMAQLLPRPQYRRFNGRSVPDVYKRQGLKGLCPRQVPGDGASVFCQRRRAASHLNRRLLDGLKILSHHIRQRKGTESIIDGTVCLLYTSTIQALGPELRFTLSGDGFLYHMVRILVGTLLEAVSYTHLLPAPSAEP